MTRVAFQGIRGAFSELAAHRLVAGAEPLGVETFEAVVRAVDSGAADAGVLPVHNRILGEVEPATHALAARSGLVVTGQVAIPVRLHLMARAGVRLPDLQRIASHPIALAQCRRLFADLSTATAVDWFDSAGAAQAVAATHDRGFAAIASAEAARVYGLRILRFDVHDRPDNYTRFVSIARQAAGDPAGPLAGGPVPGANDAGLHLDRMRASR